jgi:hypothetical protein
MIPRLHTAQQMIRWTRWIARGIGFLLAAFWLLILLEIITYDVLVGFMCLNWEMGLLVGLVAGTILSVAAAWWNEGAGGFILIL